MRYKFKTKPPIVAGSRRVKTRFLFLPKTINRETRWLERATWREEVMKVMDHTNTSWRVSYTLAWRAVEWID